MLLGAKHSAHASEQLGRCAASRCAACGAERGGRGFTFASLLRACAVPWCLVYVQVGAEEHG